MSSFRNLCILALISVVMILAWAPAQAQLGGMKDKLKKEAEKKASETVDKATGEAAAPGDTTEQVGQKAAQPTATKGGTATAEDMTLYTKYDFVPGDKVIFFDDLSGEEIGEFPSRWKLDRGVFEVAKQGSESYIMCTDEGYIRPKVAPGPLPPKYTVEMEFYAKGPDFRGHYFTIEWVNADDDVIGEFGFQDNEKTFLSIENNRLADKALSSPVGAGKHTMRIMATKSTIKCYLDSERVANVPAVEGFEPVGFRVHLDPWTDEPNNPMLMKSFRYAEGGKTLKQQLDEAGRIVTHGILFDSGSDRIKAESFKTLSDIGQLLTENPALRLSVEGHTDSDGADAANLTLSENRAKSVRTYLMESFKIDGARLETKGFGETTPIDTNDTPEGKANNRRVELVKL
jgi:OOP family OmpA-OmpF porin